METILTERPKAQPRLIYLLVSAQRRLENWMRHQSKDVSPPQAGALFVLDQRPLTPIGEVGRALGLSPSSVTGLIDRMQAQGLVGRSADPKDGRGALLSLTPLGRETCTIAKEQTALINASLAEGFSDEELTIVARWLESVSDRYAKGVQQ